ncbi:MAG: FtsQ-type POTRA domain-containing protein [bacterium]|nr:FtsQ-type POTRA domain-containing protein [bacterium]
MSAYYKSRIVYPNRKKEARKRVFGFAFLVFGICVLVGLLLWGLYAFARLEKFRIKNISVEGARVLSQDEIRGIAERELGGSFLFIIPKHHYIFASSWRIAEALRAEFPRIRTAFVKKSFPDGIKISIEERTEWGIICGGTRVTKETEATNGVASTPPAETEGEKDTCGYIDREGVLFEYPLEISGAFFPIILDDSLGEIREGDRVVGEHIVSFFETVRNRAKQEIGIAFIELEILEELPDDYRLRSDEGWYAIVPRSGDQTLWFSPLKALLEHELKNRAGLEYIDARFGNKLFYKKR